MSKNIKSFEEFGLNENQMYSVLNKKMIKRSLEAFDSNDRNLMLDVLADILPKTISDDGLFDNLKQDVKDGKYTRQPQTLLRNIIVLMRENKISNIRVYGPNHGSNGYTASDYDLSSSN